MEPIIIAVLVGIGVYVLIIALIPKHILAESSAYTKNTLQRLERDSASLSLPDDKAGSILRDHIKRSSVLSRVFLTFPGVRALYPRLIKAGLGDQLDTFFISFLVIFFLMLYLMRHFGLLSIPMALAVTLFGFWRFVRGRVRKRNQLFLNMFPDALDMIVRSVRTGHPLSATMRMVADNMQPPVSEEFKRVADEIAYGSSLMDALNRLSFRIDEPDIRFFVVVLSVQQEVGGNLAEVLSNLAGIIRRRKHLRMKIHAMTSEGRATAWVLGLLPVFEFGAIYLSSPSHLEPLFTSHLGNVVLGVAIGIVLLGALIIKQIINIEI